jgi:putative transposase
MSSQILRLKDALWERLSALIPEPKGRGRRPQHDRGCFEALIFLLRTGAQYESLPACYPPKSTVHDALKRWSKRGILEKMWAELLLELDDTQGLAWEWLSADGCLTKAPLSQEGVGKKSNRPRQSRYQKTSTV